MGKERVRFDPRFQTHAYPPKRTVTYEGRLAYAAQHAMAGRTPFDGAVRLDIVALMAIPESKPRKWKAAALAGEIQPTKKPDYDNFAKICDALNMIVWTDDSLVVKGDIEKHYSDQPMMAIRVTPIVGPTKIPDWITQHLKRLATAKPLVTVFD